MAELLLLAAIATAVVFYTQRNGARKQIETVKKDALRAHQEVEQKIADLTRAQEHERAKLLSELESLSHFKEVRDAAATAESLRQSAKALHEAVEREAQKIR